MNYQYIEQLLERYWECQTTLEEEQILRSFFSQTDLPEHLQPYASLFAYEAQSQQEHLGEQFDQRIMELIEADEAEKHQEARVAEAKTITLSKRLAPFFKAAAVVAIALCIGNIAERALRNNSVNPNAGVPTISDTYTKTEDITAKIKIIDKNCSEAIAKTDSLKGNQMAGETQDIIVVE